MTVSATRVVGFICTFAFCDVVFPPAKVPISDTSRSFARRTNEFHAGSPIVNVPISPQFLNSNTESISTVRIKGYYSKTVRGRTISAFEGIPYAKPPVGDLRFREPDGRIKWSRSFDATKKPAVCIHMDPTKYYNIRGQEDCLYFNVYVPASTKEKLPVMIWIHGGSYFHGSGNYYGPAYLLDKDVILVTFNYRLGPFGFISTGDDRLVGNFGLKDQALLIDWIYQNIEAFGGDRNKITLFGQSAGASAVHLHLMSSQTKNKINSAICQSGTAFNHWTFPPEVANLTSRFARNLGCSPSARNLADCLRNIPAKQLASSQYALFKWRENPAVLFGPVIEHKHKTAFISDTPEYLYKTGQVANVPLITGVTKDEGDLFSLVTYATLATRSLLKDADRTLPRILLYPENDLETTRKIKEFYLSPFKRPTLSGYEALGSLGQMTGDFLFVTPMEKAAEFHTTWTTAPVYAYFFSYHGQHGISEKFLIPTTQFGVMHDDDMQYLFNSTEYYFPQSPEERDYSIVEYMTTLWTNFATNRIPSLDSTIRRRSDTSNNIWKKYNLRERGLLDITSTLSMRRQPYEDRIKFWKTTPVSKIIEHSPLRKPSNCEKLFPD